MKRKSLFRIVTIAITTAIVAITLNLNFSTNSSHLSDIVLTNVEALAISEGGDCGCYGPKVMHSAYDYGPFVWCECTNDKCCMDDYGCN